jgi:hypothetical protein
VKLISAFALVALLPAAMNAAPAAASVNVTLCSGTGQARSVSVPVSPGAPARQGDDGCCVKGCHAGSSRKRGACHI